VGCDESLILPLWGSQVRFRRELAPGTSYEIVTKVCGWSDTDSLFLEQSFCTNNGNMVNCVIYIKLRFRFKKDRSGIQSAPAMMGATRLRVYPPPSLEQC
jgi:hypothetical protein